ncbi:MAG: hypothetical protein ACUZ8O_06230 [Candidatus Anammoxibacter sp.]
MYSLILDSDALIKLTRCEAIFKICQTFNCLITNDVADETVKEGKERLYPDALIIESLIKNRLIKIKKPKKSVNIKENFGKGEKSALELYHSLKNCSIVSDDMAFIKHLETENIFYFIPSDIIVLLKRIGEISLKDSICFLDKLRIFINKDIYNKAKKELKSYGGRKK